MKRDNITQKELDYYKRKSLEVSPEQRYQDKKEHWYFHESSWYMRGANGYDEQGCNSSECRFYPQTGRIKDSEVIQKHRELEERYRKNNAIVEPPPTTTAAVTYCIIIIIKIKIIRRR
jgi:hypothetical protein